MSDYCKYHPLDPSCQSQTKRYDGFKPVQTKPREHPALTEIRNPRVVEDVEEDDDTHTPYYGAQRAPTHRAHIKRTAATQPTLEQAGKELVDGRAVPIQTPRPTLQHNHPPRQVSARPPPPPRPPTAELRRFTKQYNKRLEAGKKRALELLKVGQEEIIEPRDQHKYGHMTQAAYEHAYKGKKAALNQLKKGGKYIDELNGFEIRPEFSDYDYIALHNPETDERVMVGRGSDTEFLKTNKNVEMALRGRPLTERLQRGVNDWVVNAKFMLKKHMDTSTYKNQEADLLRWAEADGVPIKSIKHAGHSKSGATGEYLARKYGGEAHIFNPATHPTSELIHNHKVHRDTKIHVYREEFDLVSAPRTYKKTPKFMEVNTYTTTPGTEDDLTGRHDHELAIPEPSRIENGNIVVKRNTKFRNRTAFAGSGVKGVAEKGIAGVKGAIMALPAIAFQPEYTDPVERKYRRYELGADMVKGIAEYEGVAALGNAGARGIGRYTTGLAPGAAIGAYTDLLMLDQQDNKVLHEGLAKVRHKIFGADPEEPEFQATPEWIKKFQTPERRRQDEAREEEYRVYQEEFLHRYEGVPEKTANYRENYDHFKIKKGDPDYLTFDEYLERYGDADGYRHAQAVEALGFDPAGDTEQAERLREVEASFTPASEGALAYSTQQAEELGSAARPQARVSQRTQYRRPRTQRRDFRPVERETFEMNGKTYVEVP